MDAGYVYSQRSLIHVPSNSFHEAWNQKKSFSCLRRLNDKQINYQISTINFQIIMISLPIYYYLVKKAFNKFYISYIFI